MTELILTQYSGKILGPIAKLLGYVMNGIYVFLSNFLGIENIGLTIIILTIFIYLLLLPLTIKQQKFSKLSQAMNPELQAIRNKYKDKKDQASVQAMNQETQMVYEKYGVSPMGSCVQILIQTPILLAMYRVVYNVPAYVSSVKSNFDGLVAGIMQVDGYQDIMAKIAKSGNMGKLDFTVKDHDVVANYIVDTLYKLSSNGWGDLKKSFSGLSDLIDSTHNGLTHLNSFIVLNIGDSPMSIIKNALAGKEYLVLFCAIMIPIVSYLTQVLNIKLMPQPAGAGDQADAMAQQMKTMNKIMPLFSLFMCFTVPVGLGLYWIAGAVCRSVQQVAINRHIRNLDLDTIIAQNQEKARKKREKMGIADRQITNAATLKTKTIQQESKATRLAKTNADKEVTLEKAKETMQNAKKGSLASKANKVREFNEKNNK